MTAGAEAGIQLGGNFGHFNVLSAVLCIPMFDVASSVTEAPPSAWGGRPEAAVHVTDGEECLLGRQGRFEGDVCTHCLLIAVTPAWLAEKSHTGLYMRRFRSPASATVLENGRTCRIFDQMLKERSVRCGAGPGTAAAGRGSTW